MRVDARSQPNSVNYCCTVPNLHGTPLYVPASSATSVRLVRKICSRFWHVQPNIRLFQGHPEELFAQDDPFLLIGDLCLEHYNHTSHSSIDLGKVWHEATKTSLIFCVVATRNEAFARLPQEVVDFHCLLEEAYQWSLQNKETIIKVAAVQAKCSEELMRTYFESIEYRFHPKHFHGLNHFAGLED